MMHTTYNVSLVVLSVIIAIAGSYTALDLSSRTRETEGWPRQAFVGAAALCMGGSIWAMHFVGMLAFGMPGMQVRYDLALTLASFAVPIAVTAISFFAVSKRGITPQTLGLGGLFMGLGIGAMHYIGMAAMVVDAELSYATGWVVLSFIIAISAATVALWLSGRGTSLSGQALSAAAMGVAISGMHYVAMIGAHFTPLDDAMSATHDGDLDMLSLAVAISAATFIVLFFGLVASMYDRRQARRSWQEASALRLSEERLRELYSKTPLPLHSLDQDGRLESVSDAWLSLVGYRREDVIGRPLVCFMTEASSRQFLEHDWPSLLETSECRDAEYRLVARAGTFVDVLASSRVERTSTGPLILGGLINVTERRQAEAALRQAQKMEAMGKLTGGIAHDFNNLLAVIGGSFELLRKRLPPSDPRTESLIENGLQATRRGAGLVQRLLSFARKQELRPSAVALPDLVIGMRELLKRSVETNISIDLRFPLDLPQAYVDANQLEMVLINLVVNARDAMPDGGSICIEGQSRTAAEAGRIDAPGYVILIVRDDGIGMEPEVLARATDPFFTTKGPGNGTGLGLSMAHGLAEQSGGRLQIHSRPGKGTTVEIWLPIATERQAEQTSDRVEPGPGPQLTASAELSLSVLVVDDDPLVLDNTASMLEDLGCQVTAVNSAETALGLLTQRVAYDILITDHMMPGMTGAQLADRLRNERPELPVLVVSGYADLADSPRQLQVLAKPFTQQTLLDAIQQSIGPSGKGAVVVDFHQKR